eukprot:CAMPEP_0179428016 /NCGR_PEP_ID=MMETSP0799-20121207/13804_1 /TAXON_ID=46947 /ORGANISM="Geminigera cryophila, Strain CCMP2564" /LENGTH=39 /DNA_ID= /DNA_START= /DNA_END= /DNA_ORIENTATION=
MSHALMSHVTRVNESCETTGYRNMAPASYHTCESVTSHV